MATIKLSAEEAEELICRAVYEEITDQNRWSTGHYAVVAHNGRHYSVSYFRGSTEHQDEGPEFFSDPVELDEVEEKEITVKKWVRVK